MIKTSTIEAKRQWRANKKIAGFKEVRVWVRKDKVQKVKDFAATLPKPTPPANPDQLQLPLL